MAFDSDAPTPPKPPTDAPSAQDPLRRADAFMSRLRPPAEDDVPLLTDVVDHSLPVEPATANPPLPTTPTAAGLTAPAPGPATLDQAAQAILSQALQDWLDTRLPDIVLRVLDGVADQLILNVTREAETDLLPKLKAALEKKQR